MIKNVVFDMGNVIIEWNPMNLSKKINQAYSEVLVKYLFQSKTWAKLDAGSISLEEGLQEVLLNAPKDYHEILEYAYYHWGEYLTIFQDTQNFIQHLKQKGYRVLMLSNAGVIFDDYHKYYPVFDLIEDKYISAHHQLTKPGKEIYLDFLNQYHLEAEECLFIDDVLDNVLGARSVGMHAYHFKGDLSQLEEMLL